MVTIQFTGDEFWDRIERAVEKVKERLRRVTRALDAAGIEYAVIGGNAVQWWVAQVEESILIKDTRTFILESLLRMKLTSYRDKDRVHVRDLLGVGLIDATWLPRLPAALRQRRQELIDSPDG